MNLRRSIVPLNGSAGTLSTRRTSHVAESLGDGVITSLKKLLSFAAGPVRLAPFLFGWCTNSRRTGARECCLAQDVEHSKGELTMMWSQLRIAAGLTIIAGLVGAGRAGAADGPEATPKKLGLERGGTVDVLEYEARSQ